MKFYCYKKFVFYMVKLNKILYLVMFLVGSINWIYFILFVCEGGIIKIKIKILKYDIWNFLEFKVS